MKYRLLGKTGLYVSELCLGAMTFGGKGMFEAEYPGWMLAWQQRNRAPTATS